MENSPIFAEVDDDDDNEKRSKDKKKSRIGLYVIKNEAPEVSKSDTQPKLELVEAPDESTSIETDVELEVEPILDEVSDQEIQEIIRPQLVEAIETIESENEPDPITDPPIERFRELVIEGDEPEEAFEEVMSDLGIEEPEIKDFETERIAQPIIEHDYTQPPAESSHQSTAEVDIAEKEKSDNAVSAVVGGIVGGLLELRKDSFKEEKTTQPVKEKLEKKVEKLHVDLRRTEKKIRQITKAKVEKAGPKVIEDFKEKPRREPAQKKLERAEKRRRAPEATVLHSPHTKQEHIGHMIVKAESKQASPRPVEPKIESSPIPPSEMANQVLNDRRIETLNRTDLLEMSQDIIIDGSSLRQIYETHLIGERGLRRLVAEHVRGGDLKKALQLEIVEREIDFERDPIVRDLNPKDSASARAGNVSGGSKELNKMVAKASANIGGQDEQAAFIRARAAYESDQVKQQQTQRRLIDISFVSIILILFFTVLFLIISR